MEKKTNNKKSDFEKLSFEQAIGDLTGIVDKIETGQVPLQQSLQQYEKGMGLIKHCRQILLDAEKRIEEITEDRNGNEPDDKLDNEEIEDDDSLFLINQSSIKMRAWRNWQTRKI